MSRLVIEQTVPVGTNGHGYDFEVGLIGGFWVGYARGGGGLFFFAGISKDHQLGVKDQREAILKTGAIAQDPDQGYGGIDLWFVPEDLRGKPDDYRCETCGEVCCATDHLADDWDMDIEEGP